MFSVAVKGTYPKFVSPPRPSLVANAIKAWRTWQITDEELERALQRGEVEVVVEMIAAGCEVVWDGQLRWDSPAYILGAMKGIEAGANRFIGEKVPMIASDGLEEGVNLTGDPFKSNGHHSAGILHEKTKVSGKIDWQRPILHDTFKFLSERTPVELRPVLTGPISLAHLCDDGYYQEDNLGRTIDLAKALNREIEGLVAAGAKQILIEEPLLLAGDMLKTQIADIMQILTGGVTATLFLNADNEITTDVSMIDKLGFGGFCLDPAGVDPLENAELVERLLANDAQIELGVVNGRRPRIESPEDIAGVLTLWGRNFPPDRIWASTTTGLGGLTREIAFQKLQNLSRGAELARRELARDE